MRTGVKARSHLQSLLSQLEKVNQDARDLVELLNEDQLHWSYAPDRWSIAQCLDHITTTARKSQPLLEKSIADAHERRKATDGAYRQTFVGRLIINAMQPDSGRRIKAPKIFRASERPDPGVLERLIEQHGEISELIKRAEELDVSRMKLRSPVSPLIRYNLGDALTLLVVHAQRHLRQAKNVRLQTDFPNS